jgi:prepilin-type N-terminal cleavage/methylation domain-containing protein
MKTNESSSGFARLEQCSQRNVWGFTLIELSVVIAIITVLAALALAALNAALNKSRMTGTMNNARQLYLAQFQMANDGAVLGDNNMVWVGDNAPPLTRLQDYANELVLTGYLKGADIFKLLSCSGASLRGTVAPGPPQRVTFTGGTAALKVHPLHDKDPSNTVFCTSRNYVYDTSIVARSAPYGTKGFIVIRKDGGGVVLKAGQATVAGWRNNQQTFQNNVGLKTGDNPGTVTPNDPANTLIYP